VRSSDIRLVSVVTSTRSPRTSNADLVEQTSTCPRTGRMSISGFDQTRGRMICSTTTPSELELGSAAWRAHKEGRGTSVRNSSKMSGRLSSAGGAEPG
jgi:hypothetical protein